MPGIKRATVVALVALAVVVPAIGCSGDDDDGSSVSDFIAPESESETDTDTGSDTEVDASDLEAALLGIDDLPSGWAEAPLDPDNDDALCGVDSAELLGLDDADLPKVEVLYAEDANTGPGFFEGIAWVPDGRAPDLMALIEQRLDGCDTGEVDGVELTVGRLSFDQLGEESFAFRVTAPAGGVSIDLDSVYIRQGDLVMIVTGFELAGDSTALMAEWAPKALDKVTHTLAPAA